MKISSVFPVSLLAVVFVFTGCSSPPPGGGRTVSASQAGRAMQTVNGEILRVDEVNIAHESSGIGTVAGAIAGGVVGSTVGGGSGSDLAAVGGALAGAAAGDAVENRRNNRQGWELEVQLADGRTVVIAQQKEADVFFAPGDQVRVITSQDGTMRVRK